MNKLEEYKTRNNLTPEQMNKLVNTQEPEAQVEDEVVEVAVVEEAKPELATKEEVNSLVSEIETLKLALAETNSLKAEIEQLKTKLEEQKELAQIVTGMNKNTVTDEVTFKNKYK